MADVKISELPALTSPDGAEELVVNDGGTTKKITITNATSAALPKAGGTMTGDTLHGDGVKSKFGTGGDLQIFHDGSNSFINEVGTGDLTIKASNNLRILSATSENMAVFAADGAATIYHNNAAKLATTATGIDVTGTVTADGLTTSGDLVVNTTGNTPVVWVNTTGSGKLSSWNKGGAEKAFITNNGGASFGSNVDVTGSVTADGLTVDGATILEAASGQLRLQGTTTTAKNVSIQYSESGDYGQINCDQSGVNQKDLWVTGLNLKFGRSTGSESMRITSSGNVGINNSSPTQRLEINGNAQFNMYDNTGGNGGYYTTKGLQIGNAFDAGESGGGDDRNAIVWNERGTSLLLGTNDLERMRVDHNGNVGIGVVPETDWASAFEVLQIGQAGAVWANNNDNSTRLAMNVKYDGAYKRINANKAANLTLDSAGTFVFDVAATGAADSAISWTNAMTIDNAGDTTFGTFSSTGATVGFTLQSSGDEARILSSTTSTAGKNHHQFFNPNGMVGNIVTTGSSTSYNTSSDYRLKTDWQPMVDATARLMQLNPVNFEWIADGTRVDGFLAHELGAVIPASATGTHNGMMDETYQATPATGDIFTAAVVEVTTESQVMETIETGSYVNLAGETIVETTEQGVTTDLVETVVQRQYIDGVSTEVEVEVTTKVPTMETVITTPAVDEIIHSSDVEQPETLEDGQAWRETTPQVMATRSVPDMQGIDQAKVVPLLVATLQEALARIEALEA